MPAKTGEFILSIGQGLRCVWINSHNSNKTIAYTSCCRLLPYPVVRVAFARNWWRAVLESSDWQSSLRSPGCSWPSRWFRIFATSWGSEYRPGSSTDPRGNLLECFRETCHLRTAWLCWSSSSLHLRHPRPCLSLSWSASNLRWTWPSGAECCRDTGIPRSPWLQDVYKELRTPPYCSTKWHHPLN